MVDFTGLYNQPQIDYKSYEDSSFVSGDSPVVLDIYTDIGRDIYNGEIYCDGDGDILIEHSYNGTGYGDQITLKKDEILDIKTIKVRKVRISHSGTDSAYRCRFW